MRYLVLNDPHLDIYAPSSRRLDDYLATCLAKLTHIRDLCDQHDVDLLVCTGDWFHKKNPQAVPHRLVGALVRWAGSITHGLKIDIATTLGNHDVQFNDMSEGAIRKQPVSLLLEVPGVHRLALAPYIGPDGVLFTGCDYRPDMVAEDGRAFVDTSQFVIDRRLDCDTIVQVTHASVLPTPQMWAHITPADVAVLSTATICHTGHIHEDLGTHRIQRADGSYFYWTNVGSMTRGSLTEETIARQPKVLLVELEGGEVPRCTELVLPHPPASEIYDVEGYREAKAQDKAFSAWTVKLQQELNATTSEETSLEALVRQSPLDTPARDLALRLLNDAGA